MPKRKFKKTGKTVFKKRRTNGSSKPLAPPRTGGFWGVSQRPIMEKKYLDVQDTTDVTLNGAVVPLNLIAAGTDFNQRIGRRIRIKSWQCRFYANLENSSSAAALRIMLVYDKQTNGSTPALTDIIDPTTTPSNFFGMINLNNRDRFVMLMDKVFALDNGRGYTMVFKKFKKLNHDTVYSATTAAIGSVATGGLFWVTVGNQTAGAADIDMNSAHRIRFIDA